MYLAIRILRWILGLLLISTLALKEDAEKKVQSRVETWWLRLAYGQDAALSRATAFLRVLAGLTGSVFDYLFGRRLFSLRGLGVSVCYSIASFFLCIQLVVGLSPKSPTPMSLEIWLLFLLFFLLGSTPAALRRSDDEALWLWGLGVTAIVFVPLFRVMDLLRKQHEGVVSARGFAVFLVLILVISSGSDFCYIALTRWMLRKASELKHWVGILGIVLLDCLLGLALFLGPIVFGGLVIAKANHGFNVANVNQASPVTLITVGIMMAGPVVNTIDFLACSLFFVLMVLMLLHRLLWPILEGPFYIFQRYGLIKHKGWLVSAGLGLLFGKDIWQVLLGLISKL
jgi:hypothetical protein